MIPRVENPARLKDLISFLSSTKKKKESKKEFEKRFAKYIGVKHTISTASARIALYLIIKNLNLEKGNKIIVPAYTASIVPYVLDFYDLIPIYVDARPDNFLMDINKIKPDTFKKASALISTPINGSLPDMEKLKKICKKYNLILIEDNAQACGATFKDKKIGSFGKAAYFSFGFSKQINTLGGGMITTNDNSLSKKIREDIKKFKKPSETKNFLKTHIMTQLLIPSIFKWTVFPVINIFRFLNKNIIVEVFGDHKPLTTKRFDKYKIKYTNFQAYIGIIQLRDLDKNNKKRNNNVKIINKILKNKAPLNMKLLKKGDSYVTYEIDVKKRQAFINSLQKKGIDSQITWMKNCSGEKEYPISRKLEKEIVSIPIHSSLSEKEIIYIANKIKKLI